MTKESSEESLENLFVSHAESDEDWMDESEGHQTFESTERVSVNQQMINDSSRSGIHW